MPPKENKKQTNQQTKNYKSKPVALLKKISNILITAVSLWPLVLVTNFEHSKMLLCYAINFKKET